MEIAITERSDGDFHIDAPDLVSRRASVMAGEWSVVRQVHGSTVVTASPTETPEADALLTAELNRPIGVQGADCAPVAFVTDSGPIAVAHVGWRGLEAGVIDTAIERVLTVCDCSVPHSFDVCSGWCWNLEEVTASDPW